MQIYKTKWNEYVNLDNVYYFRILYSYNDGYSVRAYFNVSSDNYITINYFDKEIDAHKFIAKLLKLKEK